MTTRLKKFDVSDYLDNDETIAEYLNTALETGDPNLLVAAIGDVAKARGMKQIARESGLGRESLSKVLAPGAKPNFVTMIQVLKALGVRLTMEASRAA